MKRMVPAVTVAALLASAAAWAQSAQNIVLRNSFNPVGAGARGLGMGGAFIAVADDGTAASFNPAGLSQLRRSELALVGFTDELSSTLNIPINVQGQSETRTSKTRHSAPDFIGLTVPFEVGGKSLTVQLSYQRSVDLFGKGSVTTSDSVPAGDLLDSEQLRALGIPSNRPVDIVFDVAPEQSGAFHTASLSAGYQATSRLSLGVSANLWIAEWDAKGLSSFRLVTQLRQGQQPVELFRIDNQFNQEQSLRGLNLNAGFLLKYPRVSVGGVVRFPFKGDYGLKETTSIRTIVQGETLPEPPTTAQNDMLLHWPRSVGVGVAIRPFKGMTLATDYTRSHWSSTYIENLPNGALDTPVARDSNGEQLPVFTDRNFFDLLPQPGTTTKDTDQWRIGGEYLLTFSKLVIPFRAGWLKDRSPIAELGTDEGREIKGWTAGTGLNFNRIVFDVAFERRDSEGIVGLRQKQGQTVPQLSPSEKVKENRFVGSIIYRFGSGDDPLKRLFRFLFVGPKEEEGKDN